MIVDFTKKGPKVGANGALVGRGAWEVLRQQRAGEGGAVMWVSKDDEGAGLITAD